jgi:hypothetical protein
MMPNQKQYARIIPETKVEVYMHGGLKFTLKAGWTEVNTQTADELRLVPANISTSGRSSREPLFDIVTEEQAHQIEAYEEEQKKLGTMAHPTKPKATAQDLTRLHPALRGQPTVPIRTPEMRAAIDEESDSLYLDSDEQDWIDDEPESLAVANPPPPPPPKAPKMRKPRARVARKKPE